MALVIISVRRVVLLLVTLKGIKIDENSEAEHIVPLAKGTIGQSENSDMFCSNALLVFSPDINLNFSI